MGHMTPLSGYLKVMRDLCSQAPDPRTGRNARISMADIAMSGFAVLFLQCPSFLNAQRQMLSRRGRSNAHTLFGIDDIPCDNHVRKMLDGVPPGHFDPVFHHVHATLERRGALERLRRLGGHLLVALDGTEYVPSTRIECSNCSTQKQADGTIRHCHAMVGASIVAPASAELLPLPPEFIAPQDGHDKQDCERAAVKRWLARVGPWRHG